MRNKKPTYKLLFVNPTFMSMKVLRSALEGLGILIVIDRSIKKSYILNTGVRK